MDKSNHRERNTVIKNNGFWPTVKLLMTLQVLNLDLAGIRIRDVQEYADRNYRDGCHHPQEAHKSSKKAIKRTRTLLEQR